MGRTPRLEFPGAFYHVIARGNHRQPIFHDDRDRRQYLSRLEHYRSRYGFTIYAYVLMANHVHLLLQAAAIPLSKIMQSLLCAFARFYNQRYEQVGHLFQGRYKAILCNRDDYLLELVRYLHLNPARVQHPMDPWTYPWSSHRAYMGEPTPVLVETSLVLKQFGTGLGAARQAYTTFLAEGLGDGHQPKYYDLRVCGEDGLVPGAASTIPQDSTPGPTVPFDDLARAVAHVYGIGPEMLLHQDRQRRCLGPRGMLVFLGREWSGLGVNELGRRLHRDPSNISRLYAHYAATRDMPAEATVEAWLRSNANSQA